VPVIFYSVTTLFNIYLISVFAIRNALKQIKLKNCLYEMSFVLILSQDVTKFVVQH